jgi:hypothetical protein
MVRKGGVGRVPHFSSNSKISIDIKRAVVLENRRTEEYNERSLKLYFLWDFFKILYLVPPGVQG